MSVEQEVMDTHALAAQPKAAFAIGELLKARRAHAFLLSGEPENGPLAAALHIAQYEIAPGDDEASAATRARVARGVHPDVIRIVPEGGAIRIDAIRSVVEIAAKTPFEAESQVVIIEDADTLSSDNKDAANSLLTSLEEPSGRVVYVLVARRSARVIPTIRSRCVEISFPAVADAQLAEFAAKEFPEVAEEQRNTTIRMARGNIARLQRLLSGGEELERHTTSLSALENVLFGHSVPAELAQAILQRAEQANEQAANEASATFEALLETMSKEEQRAAKSKTNPNGFEARIKRQARRARVDELRACLSEISFWYRDALAIRVGASQTVANVDRWDALVAAANSPIGESAIAAVDSLDEAEARIVINNADEPVMIGAVATELAALAQGRIRARRTIGAPSRTPEGYEIAFG